MLTKEQHIQYWLTSALEDWDTTHVRLKGKRYAFCLFSMHLVIEKLLKALCLPDREAGIKESQDSHTPPFTHDLIKLSEECALTLSPDEMDYFTMINSWNIRGRYPDYTSALHQAATPAYVESQYLKIQSLKA
jgi:HEPN domain-containing protein